MLPMTPNMSILDGMVLAVERVRDRLLRASQALESAAIPYAIAGGNAVAAWVATVDAAAVRNTQDVNIVLRRPDLSAAAVALARAGFIHQQMLGVEVFVDGPSGRARDAVHALMAGEKVREHYTLPAPDVTESEVLPLPEEARHQIRVVALEALVKMKLTSYRRKDQVHLQDMLEIGLIDESWLNRLPSDLAVRLKELIDTPEG
jgi:hypothetical protein